MPALSGAAGSAAGSAAGAVAGAAVGPVGTGATGARSAGVADILEGV